MVFEHFLDKRNAKEEESFLGKEQEPIPIPGLQKAGLYDNVEFVRNPIKFVESRIQQFGPVFATNLIGSKAVCVAGQKQIKELLDKDQQLTAPGCYRHFLTDILGDNLILKEGVEWQNLRLPLEKALSENCSRESLPLLRPIVLRYVHQCFVNQNGSSVEVYKIFKNLSVDIMLSQLFLVQSVDEERGSASKEKKLADDVFHGIQSVPVNVNLFGGFLQSGYSKGKKAKDELKDLLLGLIEEYRERAEMKNPSDDPIKHDERATILGRITELVVEDGELSAEEAAQQIVLFANSILSKSLASVLTSFSITMAQQQNSRYFSDLKSEICQHYNSSGTEYLESKNNLLHRVVLEVVRLFPPVIGGCRAAKENVKFDQYQLEEGHRALYNAYFANRDQSSFSEPEKFCPERWLQAKENDTRIYTFGGGNRICPGRYFSMMVLKLVAAEMIKYGLSWELKPEKQNLNYKWLPVAKPAYDVKMVFTRVMSE